MIDVDIQSCFDFNEILKQIYTLFDRNSHFSLTMITCNIVRDIEYIPANGNPLILGKHFCGEECLEYKICCTRDHRRKPLYNFISVNLRNEILFLQFTQDYNDNNN